MKKRFTVILFFLGMLATAAAADVRPDGCAASGPSFAEACWIGAPWDSEEYDPSVVQCAPLLRTKVDFGGRKAVRATANVTGLGFFEFYVNGAKVGDEVLSPNETSYGRRGKEALAKSIRLDDAGWRGCRVLYRQFDITDMLGRGCNVFGAMLGNGFFSTGRTRWVSPYGSPRFVCRIDVEFSDGTSRSIVSDTLWQAHRGPIVLNDLYEGEIYDARLEVPGWAGPSDSVQDGLQDEGWEAAALRRAPEGRLMPQDGPADRVVERLRPKSISRREDGAFVVDFGDYVSGWVRLDNLGVAPGDSVDIEFPIECDGNGVYRYIGNGSGNVSYAPRFCWWVFRTAVVKGWKGELTSSDIVAEVVHSDVERTGRFRCSNELLNRINDIWCRTQTDNMHLGVPTDCPHREKGPYTGDGQVACVAAMHNFDVRDFYAKWLHDMTDCQDTVTGYVPNGAPWHPGCGGGVPWGAAVNIIPWEHYMHYGDAAVLEENFDAMCAQVRFLESWREADGTVFMQMPRGGAPNYWMNLGEWCPPYNLASERLVHTWYFWRCADYTAKAARVLGRTAEAEAFSRLAASAADAFHAAFYDPATGSYGAGQGQFLDSGYGAGNGAGRGDGSNIFALAMGVPSDREARVVEAVRAELAANDGHFNTGIFGTSLFFDVLCSHGMAEEAYEAMTKRDFPSFGWWVEQGADTTWEQWNGNDSHNHPMFGGALVWMYTRLAGMSALEPGYRRILFRPTPVGDLTWASYSTRTPYGTASIEWHIGLRRMRVKTVVPKGATALFVAPDGSSRELGTGRKCFRCSR